MSIWSGRGRAWLRSYRPHLLQTCKINMSQRQRHNASYAQSSQGSGWICANLGAARAHGSEGTRKKGQRTDLGDAAVEAATAQILRKLGCRVVGVRDLHVGSAGVGRATVCGHPRVAPVRVGLEDVRVYCRAARARAVRRARRAVARATGVVGRLGAILLPARVLVRAGRARSTTT